MHRIAREVAGKPRNVEGSRYARMGSVNDLPQLSGKFEALHCSCLLSRPPRTLDRCGEKKRIRFDIATCTAEHAAGVGALWHDEFPDGPPWNDAAVAQFYLRLGNSVEERISTAKLVGDPNR